tara:strand:- start:1797 stop:1919 length:123 start_codon:yes stop_codon:yes gene_type:complete
MKILVFILILYCIKKLFISNKLDNNNSKKKYIDAEFEEVE